MSTLRQLLADLTPEQRAQFEQRLLQKHAATSHTSIPRRQADTPCPLSFAQQRLWFLHQLVPDSPFYNIAKALRLCGRLDITALQYALSVLVARHEVLQSTYHLRDEQPMQTVGKGRSVDLEVIDLQTHPSAQRDDALQGLIRQAVVQPFDISRDLLLRTLLLRVHDEEHILLLVKHHIASDRWSTGILLQELAALYTAYVRGEPHRLPELPIQYADFAVWQRQWLQGEVLDAQLAYWKAQLDGAPALLELPTDHPRPSVQTFRGARHVFQLPKQLSTKLTALSQHADVTLFMTLLAAFQVLLYRYTRQERIVVGTPIANRRRIELEGLIGFFANTLVLHTDLAGQPTFRELLQRVRQVALGAYDHQDLPFEKLVEELQPERTLRHNPLFQVMFNFRDSPEELPTLPGLTVHSLPTDNETEQFDLTLSLVHAVDGFQGTLTFSTDLFEATTIERMVGHYQTLLEAVSTNPEQSITALPLLTATEQHRLLVDWNQTTVPLPDERCMHHLFEAQVERIPEAVAVVCDGACLTYRELNQRANQLAQYLRKHGVGPDVLVGICLERSVQMLVGLLGILKAGGAYVPLDPEYPPERLAFVLRDTQLSILLSQAALVRHLPSHSAQVIDLDADWPTIARENSENVHSGAHGGHLAYVMYTSGSTGQPKGVLVCHRGVCNYLTWRQVAFPLNAADRVLQKTSFGFVDSVWEFFEPLMVGAQLYMARPGGHQDPAYLVRYMAEQQITAADFIPSLLQVVLDDPAIDQCHHLRRVTTGSEVVSPELQERFFARLQANLYNLYGPTEASIASTYWPCQRDATQRTVPIGRPIANTQIYLLDASLQLVPVGVPGELYIGGSGLARGYLNSADLTAEKFLPDPLSAKPGERLYTTGDLARYLPDGTLDFLGRVDHQVKVRGYRIEPGEIEAVLSQHPTVREAVVVVHEANPGDKRLVAYIVLDPEQTPLPGALQHFLSQKLPAYMVPAAFVRLDTMPLTPNGKVNRQALPTPQYTRMALEEAFVAPRTRVESQVAAIWTESLKLDRVGVHDNFFALGGHSLLAIQVMSRLRLAFPHVELPLRLLFEMPTVAGLVLAIAQHQAGVVEPTDLAHLVAELEGLSADDVQQHLADQRTGEI